MTLGMPTIELSSTVEHIDLLPARLKLSNVWDNTAKRVIPSSYETFGIIWHSE